MLWFITTNDFIIVKPDYFLGGGFGEPLVRRWVQRRDRKTVITPTIM